MFDLRLAWKAGSLLFGLLLLPLLAWSQAPQSNGKRVAVAKFTDQKITVDGRLTEPAWETAEVTAHFTQREPEEGKPSTELTEVRILYDQENLYIGAYCYDRTPGDIVINDISRDFDIGEQDYLGFTLDTFHDHRNGYYFATTPVGGQRDTQIISEGSANNVNWDGVWYSEGHREEDGYTIEVAIPFKTLRFSKEKAQVWGLQFIRRIRARDEAAYWQPIPRRYTISRAMAFAGELHGIENVEPGRNFQVKPYLLAGIKRLGSRGEDAKGDYDGGVDLKYAVTPSLVLDTTLNADFSHVEADTQQVNLTRFPLFFQEKREFFLENAGIFQLAGLERSDALLFHSRTIGLERGEPIPILGGARLSGRSGKSQLGLMNIQTRSEGTTPATNFTAARVLRNVVGNSTVGLLFLNRQSRQPGGYNRSFGADANFLFLQTDLRFTAAAGKTLTPGEGGEDWVSKVEGEYQNDLVRLQSSYADIGRNFNPEMGFVQRRGRRMIHQEFALKPRFEPGTRVGRLVRDIVAQITAEQVLFSAGHTEDKFLRPSANVVFQDGSSFTTQYTRNYERVEEAFRLPSDVAVPAGNYRSNRLNVSYNSNRSKPLSGNVGYNRGDYYGGARTEWNFGARHLLGYRLSTNVSYKRNNVDLPQGTFHTDEAGLRVEYSFTPKMFLSSFIQYNNDSDQISSNIRFRLIHRPLSDIYVVYNDLRDRRREKMDWSLTLKYTHLLNF